MGEKRDVRNGYIFPDTPVDRLCRQKQQIVEKRLREQQAEQDAKEIERLRKEISDLGEIPCA